MYYPDCIKNFYNAIIKKTNNPNEKWAKDSNRHLPKEDTHMAKKHVFTSLIIREMKIKTTKKHHFTLTMMPIIKNGKF